MTTSRRVVTYPRPVKYAPLPHPMVSPQPLLPLLKPPSTSAPLLPNRPPLPPPPTGFTSTQHVIPAAYPRQYLESTGKLSRNSEPFRTAPPRPKESSDERKRRVRLESLTAVRLRFDASRREVEDLSGEKDNDTEKETGLWIAAERWRREDESDGREKEGEGLTLVMTHANGFHKEAWYPTLEHLLSLDDPDTSSTFGDDDFHLASISPASQTTTRIDEIWLLDDIHHGASVDLNAGLLGPVHSWSDGGRDVINLIEHLLPDSSREPLVDGEMIPWRRRAKGRKVIGIGHSFGGNAMVRAAHARPDLFHGLFLVEPMCPPLLTKRENLESSQRWPLVAGALRRRYMWSSREEAARSLRSSPFFASWDQRVFDLYLSHGMTPVDPSKPDGPVQLATPPWCEAAIFAEPTALAEGWDRLPELAVPVGFVMAGVATATMGQDLTREMVWRPRLSKNERMMDAGHLITQEKPAELADSMWRFIGNLMAEKGSEVEIEVTSRAKL